MVTGAPSLRVWATHGGKVWGESRGPPGGEGTPGGRGEARGRLGLADCGGETGGGPRRSGGGTEFRGA